MTALPINPKQWNVGLIGYGEVGRILAEDLRKQEVKVAAYDIKQRSDQTGGALRDHASQHGVTLTASHADLAAQSDFIVSAVTASQAVPVAKACAAAVKQGAWYLDFNSASPGAKQRTAALIDAAGGRYVEGAVMTSVPPYRIKVPLLLGGGLAEGNLSRHRLGEARRLFFPARDRTWPAPQRRGARGRRDRARGRPDTVVRAGHRRASGLGGGSRRRRPVRAARHQGICA